MLAGLLRYPARNIFWKVKGNSEFPEGVLGIGDVLSHIGTSVDLEYNGKPLHVSLIQNPSHLEVAVVTLIIQQFRLQTQSRWVKLELCKHQWGTQQERR